MCIRKLSSSKPPLYYATLIAMMTAFTLVVVQAAIA